MDISVIIPCHNVAALVPTAVRSALSQTGVELEVIVVDDGSTDGTAAVVEALLPEAGGRMRLLRGPHRGASAARNRGLAEARGTYVQFLDADDALLPGKLAAQWELAHGAGAAEVVVGDYWTVQPDGRTLTVHAQPGDPWEGLITTQLGTTSANLWKREAVMRAGGWDEALASSQDYELLFRLLQAGATVVHDVVPRTRVMKRASGSISRTDEKANWLRYIRLRLRIRDHLRGTGDPGHAQALATLDQYLFMAIHLLAQQDLPLAMDLYRKHLPADFRPRPSAAITRRYIAAHRLLGFQRAVRLGRLL